MPNPTRADRAAAEPCTNYSTTRRHYSSSLGPRPYGNLGRQGVSVCPGGFDVYDDEAINHMLGPYRQGKPPIVVADLPECKPCARALAKVEAIRD